MKKQNNKNWLAFLGIGVGALAFWKYKSMPQEKKDELKSKLTDAGKKLKSNVEDIETEVKDSLTQTKNTLKKEMKKL